jgi:predicted RNA binding protein YcfA (HicA-like mRNA interferase family)
VAKLPRKISGKDLLKAFHKLGFEIERQRGSHVFLRHQDGSRLTIPVYDVVPVNLPVWILAEANMQREQLLQLIK